MSAVEEREPAPAASSAAAGAQELNNPPELEEGPSSKKRGVRLEAGFAQAVTEGIAWQFETETWLERMEIDEENQMAESGATIYQSGLIA
ncbi:uncharacterized protein [Chiloscyllium punctatum]|uniref:uncharacterized protein n=1 Tax=Chiloscyllium punctatum TaxID=137246 RepID=UPI003B636CF1